MDNKKIYATLIGLALVVSSVGILGTAYAQSNDVQSKTERKADFFKPGQFMKKIDHKVEKIDKGIIITLTSTDEQVVKEIQSHQLPSKENAKITVTQTNITNGVQITLTSEDAETVKQIQEQKKFPFNPFMMKLHKGGKVAENIQKKVEKIDNGIILTLTSSDAKVVEKLQSKSPQFKENDKVNVSETKLDNGIQLTITSTDAATVEKIQNRSENHPQFFQKHLRSGKMKTNQKAQS